MNLGPAVSVEVEWPRQKARLTRQLCVTAPRSQHHSPWAPLMVLLGITVQSRVCQAVGISLVSTANLINFILKFHYLRKTYTPLKERSSNYRGVLITTEPWTRLIDLKKKKKFACQLSCCTKHTVKRRCYLPPPPASSSLVCFSPPARTVETSDGQAAADPAFGAARPLTAPGAPHLASESVSKSTMGFSSPMLENIAKRTKPEE